MTNVDDDNADAPASRLGLWNWRYEGAPPKQVYSDPYTARLAGAFLDMPDISVVEDWGCGFGGFSDFVGAHQTYRGVDGSNAPSADVVVDLVHYRTAVEAIHMRHVLEHNPRWAEILENALASFTHYMVLTLFTPYADKTEVIHEIKNFSEKNVTMCDISFRRSDLTDRMAGLAFTAVEDLVTNSQYNIEHMFFLSRVADEATLRTMADSAQRRLSGDTS